MALSLRSYAKIWKYKESMFPGKNFKATIETALLAQASDTLIETAVTIKEPLASCGESLPGDAIDFIYATQPKEWEKIKKLHGVKVKTTFSYTALTSEE